MSLAIEAAELMEHFQWLSVEHRAARPRPEAPAVGEELADVLCYALAMANELGLDLSTAIEQRWPRTAEISGRRVPGLLTRPPRAEEMTKSARRRSDPTGDYPGRLLLHPSLALLFSPR